LASVYIYVHFDWHYQNQTWHCKNIWMEIFRSPKTICVVYCQGQAMRCKWLQQPCSLCMLQVFHSIYRKWMWYTRLWTWI